MKKISKKECKKLLTENKSLFVGSWFYKLPENKEKLISSRLNNPNWNDQAKSSNIEPRTGIAKSTYIVFSNNSYLYDNVYKEVFRYENTLILNNDNTNNMLVYELI